MQKSWIESHQLGWNAWQAQRSAQEMYDRIFYMKFLPPGRGLWAMGTPITEEKNLYAALNNCAFVSTSTLKEDYSKPVSHSSEQKNEIQEIFTDFTIKFPDSWQWGDRTGKQYNRIIYSKNVKAIRFLKRWEFENKRRIPKSWAFQMIDELITHDNINRFLQEHEDEFQD